LDTNRSSFYVREQRLAASGPVAARLDLTPICSIANWAYLAKVEGDLDDGMRSGVNDTPAFYVNGQRHDLSYGYDSLRAAIEAQFVMA